MRAVQRQNVPVILNALVRSILYTIIDQITVVKTHIGMTETSQRSATFSFGRRMAWVTGGLTAPMGP